MYATVGAKILLAMVFAVACTSLALAEPREVSAPEEAPSPKPNAQLAAPDPETQSESEASADPVAGTAETTPEGADVEGAEEPQDDAVIDQGDLSVDQGDATLDQEGAVLDQSDATFGSEYDISDDYGLEDDIDISENIGLELSGWMDVVLKHNTKDNAKPYFDVHHIYLIAEARVGDVWRAFFETEYEHLPKVEPPGFDADAQEVEGGKGEIKLERAYIEGGFDRALGARLGKFNAPVGLRIPVHWLILTPILQKPIHEDNKYVPLKGVGLDLFGWVALGEHELGYSAYVTNGSELFGTNGPTDGLTGVGADLNLRLFEQFLVGASYYHQENPGKDGRREHSLAAYVEGTLPNANLLLRSEYFFQSRNRDMNGLTEVHVFYGLARYMLHYWEPLSVAYRVDWGYDERRAAGEQHTIHNLNISLQPVPFLRFSLEGNAHIFPKGTDYQSVTGWVGMAF